MYPTPAPSTLHHFVPYLLTLMMLSGVIVPAALAEGLLLVANKGDQTLGIIDPALGRQIAVVPEDGITGHEVAASHDGRFAYVPIYGSGGVGGPGTDGNLLRVVDLAKHSVVGTVDFGKGVRPHCAVVGPKNGLLYVTTELENSITVIDPTTLKISGSIPTGQSQSHMLAITSDGRRGYTSNVHSGTVSVLDLEAGKLLKIIPVASRVQRIAISADNRWVFTSDQSQPRLAVIDSATNEVASWITLPGLAFATAATPDGRWLLVVLSRQNQIAVVDLATKQVTHTLDLPKSPQQVLVRPDGQVAYVSCDATKQVVAIDVKTWTITQLIAAGPAADGLAWATAK